MHFISSIMLYFNAQQSIEMTSWLWVYYSNCDAYSSFHSFGVALPTGEGFHSIPTCVAVNTHTTPQKAVPPASIIPPYLSWKSGECFEWLCLALICWMLRILRLLSAFLTKGNIMEVWQNCSWLKLLVYFLAKKPAKTKDRRWYLIYV